MKEGQFVKRGEPECSRLDEPATRAPHVDKAQAQLARDRAPWPTSSANTSATKSWWRRSSSAQRGRHPAQPSRGGGRAAVAVQPGALAGERVERQLGTIVRAPMSGRVGAIDVHPGSLVQLSTSLTTITQVDPVNVAFTLPESALSDLLAAQRAGTVDVVAETAGGEPAVGKLNFIDNTVDPKAGTIRVKAQFDNRDSKLWPGQYVSTRVTLRTLKDATVVPQNALIINTRGTFVYVVGEGQAAQEVPVQRVHAFGTDAVVTGLSGSEKVITEGKQNLRPGGKVRLADEAPKGDGGKRGGARRDGAPPAQKEATT
ncbi:efflux RND transporter periplasmic adaptor subunit [Massilia cavernae]|uniref:efflux RND transporter periplasmic adaptor subunit n=1 Tax=Massilia cavernae TaxID=2320864 RepID=UPI001E34D97A|nr:efflux RND transporter periplasmic adaptor subunit [Massilia cavernae]